MFMVTIVSIIVAVSSLSFAVFQIIRNIRTRKREDLKVRRMICLLCAASIVFSMGALGGGCSPFRLLMECLVSLMAMYMQVFSLNADSDKGFVKMVFPGILLIVMLFYVICLAGLVPDPSAPVFMAATDIMAVIAMILFIRMVWRRLRDVKAVMNSGNAWSFVTICVDSVYMLFPISVLMVMHALTAIFPALSEMFALSAVILIHLELMAVCVRVSTGSAFAFMHDHERIIVESMKNSNPEVASDPESRRVIQSQELYERILHYFEVNKPYLDGKLTVNDVAKVVYSNKLYISKAIFQCTGWNFRQFVNHHRVMYSMELYKDNLEMKVSELAERSGFNNQVSYTMAFRLFVNDTPSDWCRKQKSKILKPKK